MLFKPVNHYELELIILNVYWLKSMELLRETKAWEWSEKIKDKTRLHLLLHSYHSRTSKIH